MPSQRTGSPGINGPCQVCPQKHRIFSLEKKKSKPFYGSQEQALITAINCGTKEHKIHSPPKFMDPATQTPYHTVVVFGQTMMVFLHGTKKKNHKTKQRAPKIAEIMHGKKTPLQISSRNGIKQTIPSTAHIEQDIF